MKRAAEHLRSLNPALTTTIGDVIVMARKSLPQIIAKLDQYFWLSRLRSSSNSAPTQRGRRRLDRRRPLTIRPGGWGARKVQWLKRRIPYPALLLNAPSEKPRMLPVTLLPRREAGEQTSFQALEYSYLVRGPWGPRP
jgi:hypothetical protein